VLRSKWPTQPVAEIALALDRTPSSIKNRAATLQIKRATRKFWTEEDDRILRAMYPDQPSSAIAKALGRDLAHIYARAARLNLNKSEQFMTGPNAGRLRPGNDIGAAFRLKPGNIPANKGLKRPGFAPGRMRETQFKKGQRSHNYLPIGTVKKYSDGYLRRKIAEGLGGWGNPKAWEFVHRRVWEDAHGPIAKGFRLWWKDGNHDNCSLENLELLSSQEHMARTTIHTLPPELKEVVQLTARLTRKINRRMKEEPREEQAV
jgi:hypothetical protein